MGNTLDLETRSNLTKSQFLFYIAQKLQPDLPFFNMASLYLIAGEIQVNAFRQAFQTLINSSDALRTVFWEEEWCPQQTVLARLDYELEYIDLSNYPDPILKVREWARHRCRIRLPLDKHAFDSALLKISEEKYAWYFNCHQVISDAWMSALVYQRMAELYRLAVMGRCPTAIKLPSFQEYGERERQYRRSDRYQKTEAYWKRKLSSDFQPLVLYGRSLQRVTTRVERTSCVLGRERTKRLETLAARKDLVKTTSAPIFSIMAATLMAFLYEASGNPRISIGIPFHNRRSKVERETIGLLMDVFPLRLEIDSTETAQTLMNRIATEIFEIACRGAYAVSNPFRKRTYHVLLNYHIESVPPFDGAEVTTEWIHTGSGYEPLTVQVHDFEGRGNLTVDFDCDSEIFDEELRGRIAGHFLHVLDAFLEDCRRPIESIRLSPQETKRLTMVNFNEPDTNSHFDL